MAKQKHTPKKNTRSLRQRNRRIPLLAMVLLVLIAGAIAALLIYNKPQKTVSTTLVNNAASKAAPAANTNSPAPNTVVTSPTPTPTSDVPGGMTGSSDTSTATLSAPTGTFVSNHGSADQPVEPTTGEASNCITTPGASCSIQFTQNGVNKSLTAAAANDNAKDDQNGTASWSWTPASVGLTTGSWTVTAIATLNGQTKSTQDPTQLTVQ
jgi:hypothetical protein